MKQKRQKESIRPPAVSFVQIHETRHIQSLRVFYGKYVFSFVDLKRRSLTLKCLLGKPFAYSYSVVVVIHANRKSKIVPMTADIFVLE